MCFVDSLWGGKAPQFVRRLSSFVAGERSGAITHIFTVQKPFCCPAEEIIRKALESYGVPIVSYSEKVSSISIANYAKLARIELQNFENLKYGPAGVIWLPLAIEAKVVVPVTQARWAEYLLESTGRLAVTSGRIDYRNRLWGNKRGGEMPTPWNTHGKLQQTIRKGLTPPPPGRAWLDAQCSDGIELWDMVRNAHRNGKGDSAWE